jgi:putative transposase
MGSVTRHTTFSYTLLPTSLQEEALRRHVGAARFAFNQLLRLVRDALAAHEHDPSVKVPWSGFDLINAFNAWKRSEAAGVDATGAAGLPWRVQVCQQVFEEAAVDLGRALTAFSDGKKGQRRGRRPGFPQFKHKSSARQSFRLRNKSTRTTASIRVGDEGVSRSLTVPKLGQICVREDTRKLRRMLRSGRAKIWFVTVSFEAGRWKVSVNIEAAPVHPKLRHDEQESASRPTVGIDRGLTTFAVVADGEGNELERIESPRPLRRELPRLRKQSRALSRKQLGSRNRQRARQRLSRLHQRIGNVRRDFVHRESSRLAKTHGHLVIEDLCTAGLMRSRLSRSVADSAWAMFANLLRYKAAWYGAALTLADRFYPSTRRCSVCGELAEKLALSERTFHCSACGHEADRDANAATNLAVWPSHGPRLVAAKHAETVNVCGETSADAQAGTERETRLDEAERASARHPRRVVLVKTVNTL